MAYNQDNKGYAQPTTTPMSPAPQYQNVPGQPMMMSDMHPNGSSPSPMQTPPLAHQGQQQPMMYQQQANGMNYQQQPGMMQQDPNQHQMHQQQQMYGQPPPQQYQGGPTSPPGQGQQMGGGGMAQKQNDGSQFRTATAIPNLGMGAAPVDCPSCGKRGMTRLSYHAGNTTHIWAGITFCFTLCLCFIPYLMNSLKDVQHHCGNCGVLLATWHKSGAVDVHMHG